MSSYHHRFVEGKTVNVEMCIRGKMLVNQSIGLFLTDISNRLNPRFLQYTSSSIHVLVLYCASTPIILRLLSKFGNLLN